VRRASDIILVYLICAMACWQFSPYCLLPALYAWDLFSVCLKHTIINVTFLCILRIKCSTRTDDEMLTFPIGLSLYMTGFLSCTEMDCIYFSQKNEKNRAYGRQ